MDGFILNLAPTGMLPTRAMTQHVPLTVEEIVADARRCIDLGANMLHLHARDDSGHPTYRKEVYARLIGSIRETHPDVVICVSLSGRDFSEFEQRADPLGLTGDLKPDMGSLTLASMNFSRTASLNSPEMIQRLAERMAEAGIRPELEVFDAGMLNYAHYLLDRGLIRPPLYFNFLLGNIAGAQARPAALGLLINELPANSLWCGGGIGACQLAMNTQGLLYGNGARVGLEDYLWLDGNREQLASNAQLVQRVIDLAGFFDKRPANAKAVRAALGLSSHV
ncbi:3-keto-5-aminohexanoate cleavage protein [Pseudomonas sp. PB120]|uniref:3-keto-5-aminohexanoate cleavage protein n=1 Tax=Pseudomonas sp. PB120 TaxID=2494700 RepID=UPI0012FD2EB4|nr:3-keto-5-aminohexanoate cleavage protein [Pseudomonas sp. PB120]MVV52326.1 3-keto-5-aminohexanoate cleavage protein [Pseudomonas sp. PB120]